MTMSTIYVNCFCSNSFKFEIHGEGWIECPFCSRKSFRKFDGKQETYIFLEEEEVENDRRHRAD